MRTLAREAASRPAVQRLADGLGDPSALDAWLREYWRIVPDPIDAEFIRTPEYQLQLAAASGVLVGDCDDAATLAAAVLIALGWAGKFVAIRMPADVEYSHVFVRIPNYLDVDPIVPIEQMPITNYVESLEVDI